MKKIEIEIPEGKEVVDWGPEGGADCEMSN